MKKVLIAVDDTMGSKAILSVYNNLVRRPESVVLLHVQRPGGKSLMYEMLGEAEMSTLKESLEGSEHQARLDEQAYEILSFYKKELEDGGLVPIKTVIRWGHPVDEIVKVASEENADLIIVGCNGKSKLHKLVSGCVTRDVEKSSGVPVLVAKAKTGGCSKGEKALGLREAYNAR
ncbi:MAG: universal stress protein [Nitrospirae bacterium]|nr:universal stress protein [Nitrospirota bacterium]